jgi:hypothetical protein
VSATSNKSRLLIFLMIAISLVFFVASFLAAAVVGDDTVQPTSQQVQPQFANCMVVRTVEHTLADCSLP